MRWNPFKRGDKTPTPEPSTPATPSAPAGPSAPAPQAKEGRRGLLGRVFGGRRRREEKPPAPQAPPLPEPAEAPPAGGEGGGKDGGEGAPERRYPRSLGVTASGVWQISSTQWNGVMHGVLRGQDVETFISAMEDGDLTTAAYIVAVAYDENVADLIDMHRSQIDHIGF